MRDVARLAGGVHPSTVSLVLRNSPNISGATAKRVLEAAKRIGYRRDPLLDAYNHHRMGVLPHKAEPVIAWVADVDSRQELETCEPHRSFWLGGRKAAENLHCRLEPFLVGRSQLGPERLNGILQARGMVSLVLAALGSSTTRLAFTWSEYSAVKIESPHLPWPGYSVSCDQRQAARLAFRKLQEKGFRKIGLLQTLRHPLWNASQARAGFLLEQHRLDPRSLPAMLLLDEAGDSLAQVSAWLMSQKLDAVIGDRVSQAQLLRQVSGAKPPPAFAALDVTGADPSLSGILPDHQRAGAQAVEQVVSLMRANQRGLPPTASVTFIQARWREAQGP